MIFEDAFDRRFEQADLTLPENQLFVGEHYTSDKILRTMANLRGFDGIPSSLGLTFDACEGMFHPVGILYRGVVNPLAITEFKTGRYTPCHPFLSGYVPKDPKISGSGYYTAADGLKSGKDWALGHAGGDHSKLMKMVLKKEAIVSDSKTIWQKATAAAQQLQTLKPANEQDEQRIRNRLVITQNVGRFACFLGVDAFVTKFDHMQGIDDCLMKEVVIINRTAVVYQR